MKSIHGVIVSVRIGACCWMPGRLWELHGNHSTLTANCGKGLDAMRVRQLRDERAFHGDWVRHG